MDTEGSPINKDSSVSSSPFSSPNLGALLKIKVITWSQETGLPVTVRVRVGERIFRLHKTILLSRSGYFKKRLIETSEIDLPQDFPGGSKTFEMIVLFIYGYSALINPFNVASLRCGAEFLEMTEGYYHGNLCHRFDLYLNQVVLQSWEDTLVVLKTCQTLLPLSEDLLIISRCIESLAFMACMEILDPEGQREKPVFTLEALNGQAWESKKIEEIVNQDVWIKDLIALPFGFFKRIIGSLRRQGMKEKFVSPIIVFYTNKWVISRTTTSGECDNNISVILRGIFDMLPMRSKASRVIPVGFYFALLSRSIEFGLGIEKLQHQIAAVLHFANMDDFRLIEMDVMQVIFSMYASCNTKRNPQTTVVAQLWDTYLLHIVSDTSIGTNRFMELLETIPLCFRQSHDLLYRAINAFLQEHQQVTQEEKEAVCKYLNCQKLSQETCIEAVQNDLMPMRLMVQALFVQQLNTHQAFKECSDSFRYAYCGEFSGSLSSSQCPNSKSQNLVDASPYTDGADNASHTLSFLLQRDLATQRCELSRNEYESTSFRIQNLEQELLALKKSIELQSNDNCASQTMRIKASGFEKRTMSQKRSSAREGTRCIGTINFASQRRYAARLLKVFSRISLFSTRKSKTKAS